MNFTVACFTNNIFKQFLIIFCRLNIKNVEGELLNRYAKMALTDGKISISDFSSFLDVPVSHPVVIKTFNMFDKVSLFFLLLNYFRNIFHFKLNNLNFLKTETN